MPAIMWMPYDETIANEAKDTAKKLAASYVAPQTHWYTEFEEQRDNALKLLKDAKAKIDLQARELKQYALYVSYLDALLQGKDIDLAALDTLRQSLGKTAERVNDDLRLLCNYRIQGKKREALNEMYKARDAAQAEYQKINAKWNAAIRGKESWKKEHKPIFAAAEKKYCEPRDKARALYARLKMECGYLTTSWLDGRVLWDHLRIGQPYRKEDK